MASSPVPSIASSAPIRILPATAAHWKSLAALFGPRGACAGCWCMWWRLEPRTWRAGQAGDNQEAFRRLLDTASIPPGLLAMDGSRAVGWCAVGPRAEYPRLARSRVLAPVDAAPVWSVTCFFVARDWRGRGLTVRLLKAAAALARHHGARWIEGYPVDTRGGRTADAFVFTGTLGAFRSAGFREVARRSPTRPVMRRALRASARQPPAKQRSQPGRSIVDSDSFRRLAASCHVSRKTRLGGA